MKKLAIVGRPNVGKSTLFNRFVGKKTAIVDDMPGVTRDRKESIGSIADLSFIVVDTPGMEEIDELSLEGRMFHQAIASIADADIILLMIDSIAGITTRDEYFVKILRKSGVKMLLIANKAESKHASIEDTYSLGLGEPISISAEHGEGMADLYAALLPYMEDIKPAEDKSDHLQMTIIGRPNVGKSTLMNSLLGEDRMLTGAEAGITRDAISVSMQWGDHKISMIDTAGLRRRSKIQDKVEKLSASETTRAVNYANVAILVIDATIPLEAQDITIAALIEREGRACVIAINKWDKIKNGELLLDDLRYKLDHSLPQMKNIPIIPISALNNDGLNELMDITIEAYNIWNIRIPTAELNRWLEQTVEDYTPPLVRGRRWKIRYITQIKTRPPTFVLFVNNDKDAPDSYVRYLVNSLRKDFGLHGVPLRFTLKSGKNPYERKK